MSIFVFKKLHLLRKDAWYYVFTKKYINDIIKKNNKKI